MIFQALDNKKECYAIYCDGELYHYPNNLKLTETWAWSCHAPSSVDCAQVWTGGKSLQEACPEDLKPRLGSIQAEGKAFLNAFSNSKVNLDDVCFYDLVPKRFLLDYCAIKNDISKHVFETQMKPKNYDFLIKLHEFVHSISQEQLKLADKPGVVFNALEMKRFLQIKNNKKVIYNPHGTVTGRLTTTRESFPILTLPKNFRHLLLPKNDVFVELDYNSAELRTALALAGKPQPSVDIHSFLMQEIYNNKFSRDEVKQKVFAWLYNPKARNKKLSEYINKENILKQYYSSDTISTPFNRQIKVQEDKALNYLIQSTTSDMFLNQAIKIHNLLKKSSSHVAFCVHDSLVLDMAKEDKKLVDELICIFEETSLGSFKANLSLGRNFGSMRKIL